MNGLPVRLREFAVMEPNSVLKLADTGTIMSLGCGDVFANPARPSEIGLDSGAV